MAEATYLCWRDNLINKPKYFNKKSCGGTTMDMWKTKNNNRPKYIDKLSGRSNLSILAKTTPNTSMDTWKIKNLHKGSMHNIG
jgi:hypothetical protein